MTVAELIEALQQQDPRDEVVMNINSRDGVGVGTPPKDVFRAKFDPMGGRIRLVDGTTKPREQDVVVIEPVYVYGRGR